MQNNSVFPHCQPCWYTNCCHCNVFLSKATPTIQYSNIRHMDNHVMTNSIWGGRDVTGRSSLRRTQRYFWRPTWSTWRAVAPLCSDHTPSSASLHTRGCWRWISPSPRSPHIQSNVALSSPHRCRRRPVTANWCDRVVRVECVNTMSSRSRHNYR